jgi:hypothetical protein
VIYPKRLKVESRCDEKKKREWKEAGVSGRGFQTLDVRNVPPERRFGCGILRTEVLGGIEPENLPCAVLL